MINNKPSQPKMTLWWTASLNLDIDILLINHKFHIQQNCTSELGCAQFSFCQLAKTRNCMRFPASWLFVSLTVVQFSALAKFLDNGPKWHHIEVDVMSAWCTSVTTTSLQHDVPAWQGPAIALTRPHNIHYVLSMSNLNIIWWHVTEDRFLSKHVCYV